jgi:hydrogenase expression/formation protein HypC
MEIVEIGAGGIGAVEWGGVRQTADLSLLDSPAKGDFVLVHAGFAIEKIDPAEAEKQLELFRELAEEHARMTGSGGSAP